MADADRRARITLWLRIVVSVGLVAVLVSKRPDFSEVLPAGHHARTFAFLGLAFLVTLLGVVLSAWRWQRVLAVYGYHVGVARLTVHSLVGLCLNNVLPGTIGGDVIRVTRLGADLGNTEVAFGSVAIERLTGFVALPLLVVVGFLLEPGLLDHDGAWIALLIAGITLALLATILVLAAHPRAAGRFTDRGNWLRFVGAVHEGVDALRRDPVHAAWVLVAALAYQASVAASVALVATALDLAAPTAAIIAFVPAVAMVQVLPISLNGLGVREGLLVKFLHPLAVSNAQAIALGLCWYGLLLLVSLLGVPPFAAGRRRTPTTAPDVVTAADEQHNAR